MMQEQVIAHLKSEAGLNLQVGWSLVKLSEHSSLKFGTFCLVPFQEAVCAMRWLFLFLGVSFTLSPYHHARFSTQVRRLFCRRLLCVLP